MSTPDPLTVDRLPLPWVELDQDGRIEWHNARFALMLRRDAALSLTGDMFCATLAPASQVYFDLGVLPSLLLGHEMREVHLMMRTGSGEDLPVLCYGTPLPDSRISLAVLPIPERRRLESDLVSIRSAVEQVPGAVFQLSQGPHGRLRCTYFSGDALALIGVARPYLHKVLWRLMSRAARRGFARTMANAAASFSLFRFDMPIPERGTAPGSATERWLHIQARAQLQPDGQRVWFGHIMDVSQLKRAESALLASEHRYRSLAEASPIGIFHASREGRCLFANAGWREIFCIPDSAERWMECVDQPERARLAATLCECEAPVAAFELEFHVRTPGSAPRHVRLNARRLRGPDDRADGYVGTVEDITERRAMERALIENHELLRVTLESIGEAVITTDTAGCVRWINPVAEALCGWNTTDAFGRPLQEVMDMLGGPPGNVAMDCVREGLARPGSDRTLCPRGSPAMLTIEQSIAPIRSADGEILGTVVVFHDVTEQRRQAQIDKEQAGLDDLTRLKNRSEFKRYMEELLRQPQVSGNEDTLLYVDLDQFKLINDSCGHVAGDDALRKAVETIKTALARTGAAYWLARIGGDEFAVILRNSGQSEAESIGNAICAEMEDFRFSFQGRPFRLGASIGLVVIDERWQDVTSLLQAADTACYAAKEAGRNRVQAWLDGDRVQLRRMGEMQWAARVAEAIDNNRLELFAQRIEPTGGEGEGLHCELLLRLRETDGSIIMPAAFIGAAERFHMATRIDRWVIRRALQMLASDAAHGVDIAVVSINVSGQSITDPAFRQDLAVELEAAAARVDLDRLCFEITETVMANSFEDAEAFVREVHRLGARIAVDDFGVGSAGIGPLKKLPLDHIDYLKIDGDFIRDGFANPVDMVTVRYFQELARTIGARTVAEWVQDEGVRRQLDVMGVDFVQGFLIHRPEPFADLLARCAERRPRVLDEA
ncbi:MAG: EAL domain-containing protein [Pseudomonadota bacterium]|nr:EAL domain-containing protein [Pseudomonadota bacterium]